MKKLKPISRLLIVFGLYSFIVFYLSCQDKEAFWITYIFTMFAFAIKMVNIVDISVRGYTSEEFVAMPLRMGSSVYLFIQLMLGSILVLVSASFNLALITEIIVFIAFMVIILTMSMGKDYILAIDHATGEDVAFNANMQVMILDLYNRETSEEKKKVFHELYECIRYSDPIVPIEEIRDLDRSISSSITTLGRESASMTVEDVENTVKEIMNDIHLRNEKCKLYK